MALSSYNLHGYIKEDLVANRLLNNIFFQYSSLQKENISSFTRVNSNNIYFSSLDYRKNIQFTKRFENIREVV